MDKLTSQAVQDWVRELKTTPVAGTKNGCMTEGTVRNTLSVLSGCLRDAQKYGLIEQNPCVESAWVLKSKNVGERREWLSREQVLLLEPSLAGYQDKEGYPTGLGFRLMLYTGITISEAVALRWEDVDFEEEKLTLRTFVSEKRSRQSGEQKHVLVPDFLMREMHQVQSEYDGRPEEFVLNKSGRDPVRIDRMRAALARKSRACGMGTVTPRMLRDTYAMRAVHAGASSDMIAELLGFSSSRQVIRRYMPEMAMNKKELVKKMFE